MIWQIIQALHEWECENLPGAHTPQAREVFVWLLKSRGSSRPLKDLYRSSRFSEPTIRACLKEFAEHGFCTLVADGRDMRARYAKPTLKLEEASRAYEQLLWQFAANYRSSEAVMNASVSEPECSVC